MKALQNIRQVVELIKEEVDRHRAKQGQAEVGGRDAYQFDVGEDDIVVEEQVPQRNVIEITEAAPSYRESHRSYRRAGLVERLRDTGTLRDAILLNEILRKPLALRRRS